MNNPNSLASLGWHPFFQQQLSLEEWDESTPARIIEQHKSLITVRTENADFNLEVLPSMPQLVVGDWLLLDRDLQFSRLLERKTCFKRKAAGEKHQWQFISANVDTAFIVSSLNEDFNLNRIERYLSLVHEAAVEPVIVLSKSDLSNETERLIAQVQSLDAHLCIEAINCLDATDTAKLTPWINEGSTIAVLGSSGVGKSTLTNTLIGENKQNTSSIRIDDGKGRHTTTRRSLISLPNGGLILDTPGMRELQLADCQEGLSATFADIEAFAENCRFADCQHQSEPNCAVRLAIDSGELERRRLDNYLKLRREEALNSASLADTRARDKALGKYYKRTLDESHKLKGR